MNFIVAKDVTAPRVTDAPAPGSLRLRVISALILAPIVLAFVWAGGAAFAALLAITGVLMATEWERLTGGTGRDAAGIVQIASALSAIGVGLVFEPEAGLYVVAAGAVGSFVVARSRGAWAALGTAYVGLPLVSLLALRDWQEDGFLAVLWLMAVVWSMDIFAYVAGRSIGGPKLAPSISPKKTWAGLIGGALASTMAGWVFAPIVGAAILPFALLSGALGVFSQMGDLFESFVKRRFGVKDSGNLIPGHGGMLDRVDGLVFAAVASGVLLALTGSPFGFG